MLAHRAHAQQLVEQVAAGGDLAEGGEVRRPGVELGAGLPEFLAELLANSDTGVSKGGLFDDGKQLSKLIGRPTTALAEAVKAAISDRARFGLRRLKSGCPCKACTFAAVPARGDMAWMENHLSTTRSSPRQRAWKAARAAVPTA